MMEKIQSGKIRSDDDRDGNNGIAGRISSMPGALANGRLFEVSAVERRCRMVSLETYRMLAADLPGAAEQVHSGMPAFAVGKKRFSIFDPKKGTLAIRLPLTDSASAEAVEKSLLEPAPGKYGAEGWVSVDMERIGKDEFAKLLAIAHGAVVGSR